MQETQAKRMSEIFLNGLERLNLPAKAIQLTSGIKQASFYNYLHGRHLTDDGAMRIAKAMDDPETMYEIAHELYQILPMLNGDAFKHDAISVEAYEQLEAEEADQMYQTDHIHVKLAKGEALTNKEGKQLDQYMVQRLQDLLLGITLLNYECQLRGITLFELYKHGERELIEKHYRKED